MIFYFIIYISINFFLHPILALSIGILTGIFLPKKINPNRKDLWSILYYIVVGVGFSLVLGSFKLLRMETLFFTELLIYSNAIILFFNTWRFVSLLIMKCRQRRESVIREKILDYKDAT